MDTNKADSAQTARIRALILGALGVVYGDIGTSPLYTVKECFTQAGGFPTDHESVLGVLSLLFWALLIVVTVKYVVFIMRADNQGEGGILALTALALRGTRRGTGRARAIMAIGVIGAALFYGDSFITPAISVLSAVEGLTIATPVFDSYVVPITVVILLGVFLVQQRGTALVGGMFGPVMVVWFSVIGLLGLIQVVQQPQVLAALNPMHGFNLLTHHGFRGFEMLGAVVLAITGGEALYADMGHFGRRPIRWAWYGLVLPALLMNYFGQGALLISDPTAIENPFYRLAPDWALYPMVILSTMATVIASQAVISGAYSMTQQAIHLRYLPRLQIRHTSEHEIGQIYMPEINWLLMFGVIALVLGFKTSSALAGAYGIAVTGTMVATTLLAYMVARRLGRWSFWQAGVALAVFLTVDTAFFGANLIKVVEGGWFPLAVAAGLSVIMITWRRGRNALLGRLAEESMPLEHLLERLKASSAITRVPGTAVFLTSNARGLPPALMHNLKHNKVLHQRVVLLTVAFDDVPFVASEKRFELTTHTAGVFRLILHFGFREDVNLPQALQMRKIPGLPFEVMDTSFFISRETLIPSGKTALPRWQEPIFIALSKVSLSASDFFCIPPGRVVELGMQVEI